MLIKTDLCVIGAGSGGLSTAVGASQMGADVVLIEGHKMGGDCLNYGCVPSKALLSASHIAQKFREAGKFGIAPHDPLIDFKKVQGYLEKVIGTIAPHDSVERMESLGIQVIRHPATFINKNHVKAGDFTVRAKRFVIATGSSPQIPPLPGLDKVPFFTNETIFSNKKTIKHLIVIGGGPIGVEMAQAHRQLGSNVSVFQRSTILHKDDPEAVAVVREMLHHLGVAIYEGTQITNVGKDQRGIIVHAKQGEKSFDVRGTHLLVATGRQPNIETLNLEKANIKADPKGIMVNSRLRTSNHKIYAIGDVARGPQFTHWAGYHAGIVIRNILFSLPAQVHLAALPWVTYTDPELAQVGLNEPQADKNDIEYKVLKMGFDENDRAQAEGDTRGFMKILVSPRGKILGATIVGTKAGELLAPWTLALSKGCTIGDMAGLVLPYPTRSELSKRVAGQFFTPRLFGKTTRKIVRWLMRFRD